LKEQDSDSSSSSSESESESESESSDNNNEEVVKRRQQQSLAVGSTMMGGGKLVLKHDKDGGGGGGGHTQKTAIDHKTRKLNIFRMLFDRYDKDESKSIESCELVNLMKDLKWDASPEAVSKALRTLDKDSNGTIEFDEFIKWTDYAWSEHACKTDDSPRPSELVMERKGASSINNFEHHSVAAIVVEEEEEEEEEKGGN